MRGVGRILFQFHKQLHSSSRDGPSETLKRKIAELERIRKKKNPKKDQLFVEVPESKSFLDTATMPMVIIAVGGALFAKLLMMYDESKSQEMIEHKIKNAPAGQGTVRMLTREEWEEIKEVRPRTPFESKLARPNARIRTGEPLHMEDLKDWTIDVLTDALTRVEESVRQGSK
uniref:Cytoplasmic dynein 2 light intermediate chain 1 n=1 Tax=Davidia involucrata TaxID=16924 RepID=A0A5B7A925_DAVIN